MKRVLNIVAIVVLCLGAQSSAHETYDVETNREIYRAYREMSGENLNAVPETEEQRTTYNIITRAFEDYYWHYENPMETELEATGRFRKTQRIRNTSDHGDHRRLNPDLHARYFGWALADDNCTIYCENGKTIKLNPKDAAQLIEKLDAIDEGAKAGALNFDQVMRERERVVANTVSPNDPLSAALIASFGDRNSRVVAAWRADEIGYADLDRYFQRQEQEENRRQEIQKLNEEILNTRKLRKEAEMQGNLALANQHAITVGLLKKQLKSYDLQK